MTVRKSAPPGSIQPLDTLPVFFRAAGRRMVVIGGTDAAAWKVELLASAGARLDIFATEPSAKLREIVAGRPDLTLHARSWAPEDFAGALAIVAEAADESEARAIVEAARKAGVPVNIVDRPEFCDFQFGSIVNRSPLVIGISTGGAAPVFGQAVRARIETLLPQGFASWAQAARRWREHLAAVDLPFRARRSFWELFAQRALARPAQPPDDSERDAMLAEAATGEPQATARGKALLVGAGPGDPELVTLRAVRALQSADVILHDDLAAPEILDMARREADRVFVGKRGGRASLAQAEITAMLVELVRSGKTVVRLKGGDPMVFGRANEEIAALQEAGLDVEVVPGVTAASGAAAALLASLTSKEDASRVQFVTAHAPDGGLPEDLDWAALADPMATTVVYMGVRTLPALAERLLQHALPGDTPAILVENATRKDERILASTLASIAALAQADKPSGPCLVIIGRAMRAARRT
jgi:uroporphyrin-III C-methyltransferase / precorrin-2 dehydrogenase / sirohydrochlorin ferrochelatase